MDLLVLEALRPRRREIIRLWENKKRDGGQDERERENAEEIIPFGHYYTP